MTYSRRRGRAGLLRESLVAGSGELGSGLGQVPRTDDVIAPEHAVSHVADQVPSDVLVRVAQPQNVNLVINCTRRGGPTELMAPTPNLFTRLPLASYGRFVIVGSVRLLKKIVLMTPE